MYPEKYFRRRFRVPLALYSSIEMELFEAFPGDIKQKRTRLGGWRISAIKTYWWHYDGWPLEAVSKIWIRRKGCQKRVSFNRASRFTQEYLSYMDSGT